jgi:hypothetical protein
VRGGLFGYYTIGGGKQTTINATLKEVLWKIRNRG